jgi:LysR family hydrogen peroxide-inducible transcriptional activator
MIPDIELRALAQFVVLARVKNFTRAALELNLSQPALSRAIGKLEERIGLPLFERKPRALVLTVEGEVLRERARRILDLVDDAFLEVSVASRLGRVRLGAIPTIAPFFLPQLLADYGRDHPRSRVVVQEDTTGELVRRCVEGDLDVAIVALPITEKLLRTEVLFEEELLLVTPVGHSLQQVKEVTANSLNGFPLVMLNEAHCLSGNIAAFCQRESIQPITVERTSQLAMVQELVSLDHGVSLVPEMARRLDGSARRCYRSFAGVRPMRKVAMMWNPYRFESEAVKVFKTFLRQSVS